MIQQLTCLIGAATALPAAPGETSAIVAIALPPSEAVQAPLWDVPLVYGDLDSMVSTALACPVPPAAETPRPADRDRPLKVDLAALADAAAPVPPTPLPGRAAHKPRLPE